MDADPRFREGLRLFDEREYFECHEVIEELWLETPSEDRWRDLYKGVIQAAAAVYQFRRGILSGAVGLYRTSTAYLEPYRPSALGLDVDALLASMRRFFAPLEGWDGRTPVKPDEALLPRIGRR